MGCKYHFSDKGLFMKSSMQLPSFFKSSSSSSSSSGTALKGIHENGYQVIRGVLKVDERVLGSAQSACDKQAHVIFNHNEMNKRNDFKRRQRSLPLASQYMRQFDASVKKIIKESVNTDLIPTDPVIIHSRPGCQPQAAHCDYIPDETLKAVKDTQMPLAVLIALMPGTRLKVWPNSAHLALQEPDAIKKVKPIDCVEVALEPGDMLVFRGDFVHAGSGYEADNYRIHYYLDSPLVPRVANRTWLISESDNPELKRIIRTETKPAAEEKEGHQPPVSTLFAPAQSTRHKHKMDASVEEPKRMRMSTRQSSSGD
jgi:hypothetical protein